MHDAGVDIGEGVLAQVQRSARDVAAVVGHAPATRARSWRSGHDSVLDPRAAATAARQVEQIGDDLALEVAVQLAS